MKINRVKSMSWQHIALISMAMPVMAEPYLFELQIKEHLFHPSVLYVPAGIKIKLRVLNQDPSPEEFESFSLNREKVILGNSKATLFIGPLQPGNYQFFGEYNPDSAQGVLIALPDEQWQQHRADNAN